MRPGCAMIKGLWRFTRTSVFLGMLCFTLATAALSMSLWAINLTAQVATITASAASKAIAHRNAMAGLRTRMTLQREKAVAKAVAKTKAKARLRRSMAAIPVLGIAAVGYFEHRDYEAWKQENPESTFGAYGCEVGTSSAEVLDEVLQELPETFRLSPDMVLSRLPKCEPETL